MCKNNTAEELLKDFLTPIIQECIDKSLQKYFNDIQKLKSDTRDVMNLKDTCGFLNLTPSTIYSLTCRKRIPHIKSGKRLYFRKSELEKWLDNDKVLTIDERVSQALNTRRGRK